VLVAHDVGDRGEAADAAQDALPDDRVPSTSGG